MKFLFILFTTLLIQNNPAQHIDFDQLNYREISGYTSEDKIIETLGAPLNIYDPEYECGFLSSSEQMKEFETLDYKHVQFTGNVEDLFILDQINYNNEATCIFYKESQLNNKTTITELIKIFGESYFKDLKNNSGNCGNSQ